MPLRPERLRRLAAGTLATLVSAGALWHGSGLAPAWWLAWLAPWPVLAFATGAGAPAAAAAAFLAWAAGGLNVWHYCRVTLGVPLPIVLLTTALPAAVFTACVLLHRRLARRGRPWLAALALPVAWTAFEHVLARVSPHGTFGSLAYTQLEFLPIVQLAAVCGGAGVTFLVLLLPSALALATAPTAASQRWRIPLSAAAIVAGALAWGSWRLRADEPGRASLRVGLVAADRPEQPLDASSHDAPELIARYAGAVTALGESGADVVVLPETVLRARPAQAEAALARLAGPRGDQSPTVVAGFDRLGAVEENAALALAPQAATPAAYAKQHLLLPPEARYRAGSGLTLVTAGPVKAGIAICKDLDFPALGRDYARAGAALLLVPAWDFGVDGWLHSRMAVLRGVEGGFAVARSARGGRLTLSDDRGRVRADVDSASQPASSVLAGVRVGRPGTVYSALGDWLGWLCCGLLAALLRVALAPAGRPARRAISPAASP